MQIVLCHHGVRSMRVSEFLIESGFNNVKNIMGGIDAYSKIDSSIPIY